MVEIFYEVMIIWHHFTYSSILQYTKVFEVCTDNKKDKKFRIENCECTTHLYMPLFSSWKIDRDACSSHCGRGTAKQYIACSLTTRYNTTLVDMKHCEKRISEIGPRPKEVVVCYGKCLETNWKYSEWTRVNMLHQMGTFSRNLIL